MNVALFCVVDGIFTQDFTVRGGFKQNEYIFEKKKNLVQKSQNMFSTVWTVASRRRVQVFF